MRICEIDGCGDKLYGHGFCSKHYQRWRAHGDPATKLTLKGEPLEVRFAVRVERRGPDECWPWTGSTDRQGYGMLSVNGKNVGAHRVALFLATGVWPVLDTLHSCDNPPCCNEAHLSEGTHAENMRQMIERGRRATQRGDAHPGSKLTPQAISEAQQLRDQGWKLADLGGRYGVSLSTIGRALQGLTWVAQSEGYVSAVKRGGERKHGENHHRSKVNDTVVAEMRALHAAGSRREEIAERFGLSKSQTQRILTGEAWPHLPATPNS